jgi:hypothetical protein
MCWQNRITLAVYPFNGVSLNGFYTARLGTRAIAHANKIAEVKLSGNTCIQYVCFASLSINIQKYQDLLITMLMFTVAFGKIPSAQRNIPVYARQSICWM